MGIELTPDGPQPTILPLYEQRHGITCLIFTI